MDEGRDDFMGFASRRQTFAPDLTAFDPATLAPPALAAARFVWARRVTNESASIEVSKRLLATATTLGLAPSVLAALKRLESDEALHARLARAMLERLGELHFLPAEVLPPLPQESAEASFARQVVCALCIGESVSASRYAAVREATDLAVPRACIELFLRDEVLHGQVGFSLLPGAIERLAAAMGANDARAFVERALSTTLHHLEATIGMDAERRGMPVARSQPADNPGVVEPTIDALAFYDAVTRTILPSFEACGVAAARLWTDRWRSHGQRAP